jgi:ATP-binding cassette, subfamily B, bacterial PglK
MIVGILLIAKPIISISLIAFLGIVYFTLFSSLKEMIKNAGKERVIANEKRFHSLRDLFGSIKEIKSLGKENYFLEYFSSSSKKHASIESKLQLVAHLPRYLIEAMAFGSMIIIVILLILNGYNFATIAPTLTLFALASYRILPAMQQIHYALTHLRYSGNLMQRLEKDLASLDTVTYKPKNHEKLNFNNEVILSSINYRYPFAKLKALKNICIEIKTKGSIGIVGASGSGKTTLINIILGLIKPDDGKILVDKTEINQTNIRNWQNIIGYVPQQIYILDDNVINNIAFGVNASEIDIEKVKKVAKIANIHNFIMNELSDGYQTNLGERGAKISGGERQRIGIARALYNQPKVLILDEATSSLDNLSEEEVINEVKKLSKSITIIIVAHRLTTVENCDEIYLLENGIITEKGNFTALRKQSAFFKQLTKQII